MRVAQRTSTLLVAAVAALLAGCQATPATAPAAAPSPAPAAATAPARPDSDIYLASLNLAAGTVGAASNVTRHPGYDNQPAFVPGADALWFVSDRSGSTDVYRYDIAGATTTRVTATNESEFSPTALPDGPGFSATHVIAPDAKGDAYTDSQQLWRYSANGKPLAAVVSMGRIGYHAWLDANRVALFIVGSPARNVPNTLLLADLAKGGTVQLASDAGRSLGRTPDGKRISFLDKRDPANWTIVAMAPGEAQPTPLVAAPAARAGEAASERSEDYAWLPDGGIMMAQDQRLLRWDGKPGGAFKLYAELPNLDGAIKRLAVSSDGKRIAFVVQKR
jgi:hypothetical protein